MRNLLKCTSVITALGSIWVTGCVARRNWDLSPTYDKTPIPSPAIVLPVQVCAGDTHGAAVNVNQRKLANRVWPEALWKGLHLPGPTREGRRAKTDWFCDFASYERDTTQASSFALNVIQRDELAKIFAEHPDAKTVVIPYFSNLMASDEITETVTDTAGRPIMVNHTGVKQHTDTGAVVFGVFVFTASDIVYMTASTCGGENSAKDCMDIVVDADYTNANVAVVKRLRSFPWQVLGLTSSPTWEGVGEADASLLVDNPSSSASPPAPDLRVKEEPARATAPAGARRRP